jgi:hypothetical protein
MLNWTSGVLSVVNATRRGPGRRSVGRRLAAMAFGVLAIPAGMESAAQADPPPRAAAVDAPVAAKTAESQPATVVAAPTPADTQKRSETAGPIITFIGLGIGVVGVATGAIAGARSLSKTSDLKDVCPNNVCPANRQSDYDSAHHLASISDAGFVVAVFGVGLAITGIVLWHDEATAASGAQARAVIGPGTVAIQGRF